MGVARLRRLSGQRGSVHAGLGSGSRAFSTVFGDGTVVRAEGCPISVPHSCAAYLGTELRPGKKSPRLSLTFQGDVGDDL